jgi:hypothetical protein
MRDLVQDWLPLAAVAKLGYGKNVCHGEVRRCPGPG